MKPVHQIFPKMLCDELLRITKINREWMTWERLPDESYEATTNVHTWIRKLWVSGADAFSMWAASHWLTDGPKVFCPTVEQCEAMEQVEVNIQLHEYEQPYPAIMVDLPQDKYAPFECVLCHKSTQTYDGAHVLTFCLQSTDHLRDITTTVAVDGRPLEVSVQKFDANCAEDSQVAGRVLRIAINSCLCLVNYGCKREPMRPKEVERDRKLASEQTDRGKLARERLKIAPQLVSFAQVVKLHDDSNGHDTCGDGEPSGREVRPHWRRGHWAMLACGKGRTERRRVLRKPCLVRSDKFAGDLSETSTTYKS